MTDKPMDKRLAFMTKCREQVKNTHNGLKTLMYIKVDVTKYLNTLNQISKVFVMEAPPKQDLMNACTAFENLTYEMAYDFAKWLGDSDHDCDPSVSLDFDKASMDYASSFSKALDAKQKGCVGFDLRRP